MKTIHHLRKMKQEKEKIAVLTAYDASFARVFSQAGVDALLVGDSLGSVIAGHKNTITVQLDDVKYHVQCVARGNTDSFIIADLPFMTYANPEQAIKNAAQLIQAGAHMVKLEGGQWLSHIVSELTQRGIPVCGHIGLTTQYIHMLGGYKIQGRDDEQARRMLDDALALQQAGCDLIVIECVPEQLAGQITEHLTIPTIGIGAGRDCDGQVLVSYDILGLSDCPHLTFVKNFLGDGNNSIESSAKAFVSEVKNGLFPAEEHCFK